MIKFPVRLTILCLAALSCLAMARNNGPQYDMEAREQERLAKQEKKSGHKSPADAAKNIAGGVKQATVDTAAGFVSETAEGTREEAPVVGTLEGARKGTQKVLDSAVKGVGKVATLGYGDVEHYEVEEPEANTDQTTKIKIKIPGT